MSTSMINQHPNVRQRPLIKRRKGCSQRLRKTGEHSLTIKTFDGQRKVYNFSNNKSHSYKSPMLIVDIACACDVGTIRNCFQLFVLENSSSRLNYAVAALANCDI